MFRVVAFCGKARSGKDTAASAVTREHGHVRYALADPIKRGIETMFNLHPSIWDDDHKEQVIPWLGKSPRQLAQTLGTEWGRDTVATDVWLRCADQFLHSHRAIVIPDVRFRNEVEWVRSKGGVLLKIVRPEVKMVADHPSEDGIPEWLVDAVIINDSDPYELKERIIQTLEDLYAVYQTEYVG